MTNHQKQSIKTLRLQGKSTEKAVTEPVKEDDVPEAEAEAEAPTE